MERFFQLDKLSDLVSSFEKKEVVVHLKAIEEKLTCYDEKKRLYEHAKKEGFPRQEGIAARDLTIGFKDLKACSEILQKTLSKFACAKGVKELIDQYPGSKCDLNYIEAKKYFELLQEIESTLAEAKSLENDPVLVSIRKDNDCSFSIAYCSSLTN